MYNLYFILILFYIQKNQQIIKYILFLVTYNIFHEYLQYHMYHTYIIIFFYIKIINNLIIQ